MRTPKEYKKVCAICGKEFVAHSHVTKVCSDACRRVRARQLSKEHDERKAKQVAKDRAEKKKKVTIVDIAVEAKKHGMTYGQYVAHLECEKSRLERERRKRYNAPN